MPSFIFSTNSNSLSRREKVADWAGHKKEPSSLAPVQLISRDQKDDWEDVHTNIKQMDQFYDATFYAWLKSEENVLVTSIYLHRIANQYPLERVINAFEWLTHDWRWESTSILVRHVTVDWCDEEGDIKRAKLLSHLTMNWATHFTATLITTILISSPYASCSVSKKRERFIREFTKDWDFSKLSEFFMFLRSRANIDYKFKCMLLQEAARKDNNSIKKGTNSSKKSSDLVINNSVNTGNASASAGNNSIAHHHRRTSSNDFQEMKRTILEEMEEENHHHPSEQSIPPSFSSMNDRCYNTCVNASSSGSSGTDNASPSTSSVAVTTTAALHVSSSSTSSRYHHVNITSGTNNARLCTSSSTLTMTVTNAANPTISSSSSTSTASINHTATTSDITPSPSSSSTNNTNSNNNDKRRITVI